MPGEHIPDLPEDAILELAEIDLAIEDVLRSLDDCLKDMEIEEIDRSLIIHHVRMAYITGFEDGHEHATGG